ncbi:MAG TPA: hypothetical protein VGJ94_07180 [Syntrophorhabdaceae bacterium]|jgi:hypothetical protein
MNWFEKFAKVVDGLDPIIEGLAAFAFPEAPVVAKAVKYGVTLVKDAEEAWGGGQGPLKKGFVMKGAGDFLRGLVDCSTGGQRATLEKFVPFMSAVVEGVVEGTRLVGVAYDEETPATDAA